MTIEKPGPLFAKSLQELERIASDIGEPIVQTPPRSRINALAKKMLDHEDVKRIAVSCIAENSPLERLFLVVKQHAERDAPDLDNRHLIEVTLAVAKTIMG